MKQSTACAQHVQAQHVQNISNLLLALQQHTMYFKTVDVPT